jgi:hypothetical protein
LSCIPKDYKNAYVEQGVSMKHAVVASIQMERITGKDEGCYTKIINLQYTPL